MLTKLFGAAVQGIDATIVTIEVNSSRGIKFFLVGLPDSAVKESHERIMSALQVNGYKFPTCQIVVNMAPADIRKGGSSYDLPLAIGILAATGTVSSDKLNRYLIIGELGLDGNLQPIKGALPIAICAREQGLEGLILPKQNAREAAVVNNLKVFGVENITEVIEFFNGIRTLEPTIVNTREEFYRSQDNFPFDFADVKGQSAAKKALEVAAAGGHNVLMIGSPGSGKSMLAKRMPSILPAMTFEESIETTNIHSVAGLLDSNSPLITTRPFRSPHHTVSPAGLSGGGSVPKPGEISLAHNGLLFLDELAEFSRPALEILRQPLEDRQVTISRVSGSITYPCSFMLIAAMNPCPCGYFGHPTRKCICSPKQVSGYLSKVSGPLLDRFDIHLEVAPVEFADLSSTAKEESSASIRERVQKARDIQNERFKGTSITCNARITSDILQEVCPVTDEASKLLENVFDRLGLSARAYDRILKVARTVADMDGAKVIDKKHIAMAVQYRSLDRKYWNG